MTGPLLFAVATAILLVYVGLYLDENPRKGGHR